MNAPGNGKTQQQTQITRYSVIKDKFNRWSQAQDFKELLPEGVDPQRLVRVALANISKTPKLQECTEVSLWRACGMAAELGLEPGGALGLCYLVPYGDSCQFILGYQGLIELGRRSGALKQIGVHLVYPGERFEYWEEDDGTHLFHEPQEQKDITAFTRGYCRALLKDGGVHIEHMWRGEILAIRDASPGYQMDKRRTGPWNKHPAEMAKKTILRRAFKYLPKSPQMARAFESDDDTERELNAPPPTRTPPKPQAQSRVAEAELVPDEPPAPAEQEGEEAAPPHDPVTGLTEDQPLEEPPDDVPLPTADAPAASRPAPNDLPPQVTDAYADRLLKDIQEAPTRAVLKGCSGRKRFCPQHRSAEVDEAYNRRYIELGSGAR